MTEEISIKEVLTFVKETTKQFSEDPIEWGARIAGIWIIGAAIRLSHLGVIGGFSCNEPDGIELWETIDRMRFYLIPPQALSISVRAFTEIAAFSEIRKELAAIITVYYTESGRERLTVAALERVFTSQA